MSQPCWRINGILVTLWYPRCVVKIYHAEGRKTVCFDNLGEACREHLRGL
jgi:hypothetical protein